MHSEIHASTAICERKLSEQNMRLDGAINNMIQGLCMFDAQTGLLVWNERYRAMYNIDPRRIWHGCTILTLLDARIAAGTVPTRSRPLRRRFARGTGARRAFTDRRDGRRARH